jgi:hypothetical protein
MITTFSQSVKWAENAAPILFKNCAKCHNNNGIAPFPLITYNDAYNNRFGIKRSVVNKTMPPWTPDPNYNRLAHERVLTDSEINTLRDWVDGGAPQGDISKAPTPPVIPKGGEIINPSLTLKIPTYNVNTTTDLYRNFAIPSGLIGDRTIIELEVIPGNRQIVHHVLAFRDTSSKVLQLDQADPLPGFTNFGGTGSNSSQLIMGYVPGQGKITFPTGMGMKLLKNTNIVLQIHYPGGVSNKNDSTKIIFKFAPQNNLRELSVIPILNHSTSLTNGPLIIQPNTVKQINAEFPIPSALNATFISIAPHMHLVGKRFKVYGILPNKDTLRLINIPEWDFSWQGSYNFRKAIKIPGGTILKSETIYDNTVDNPLNPHNPPQIIRQGEGTGDEMMLVYFTFTGYQPGDENIVLDSTAISTASIDIIPRKNLEINCFPNPAKSKIFIEFVISEAEELNIEIFDSSGELVKRIATNQQFIEGNNKLEASTHDLVSGLYYIKVSSNKLYGVQKILKIE